MSRRRALAERAVSRAGVTRPTIFCTGDGYFHVRLPGSDKLVQAWDPTLVGRRAFPYTYEEALARVALYYAWRGLGGLAG